MMEKKNKMGSGKSIDEIILKHSTRGMDVLQKEFPIEHCDRAVREFTKLRKGNVFLYTGFYVNGFAETDGPVGTYFLARALNSLGYDAVIITDKYCHDFFIEVDTVYIPIEGYPDDKYEKLLSDKKPVAHISIERCGVNASGKYANMRGKDISDYTAPLDKLYSIGAQHAPTFAVGDGGNEIGMGNFKEAITKKLSLDPCIIPCDYPVIASVSNWGAYGFIAMLEILNKQTLLPTFQEVDKYLEYIVSLGSVDGVKSENVKSVDGKDWAIEAQILNGLKSAVISHFNSFSMTSDYDLHSKSQLNIGYRLIRKLAEKISIEGAECLDLGCGPGTLTNRLREECNEKKIKVIGVDIDKTIVDQAQKDFPDCEFVVGSFYESGNSSKKYDYIFSNEGLHWTPRIPEKFMDQQGILYPFFEENSKQEFRQWGLENMNKSFSYISETFTTLAALQFGLDGQLKEVYELINDVLKKHFPEKSKSIKFPLFYPTTEEVMSLCSGHGLKPVEFLVLQEDLFEETKEEIVQFIRAFTENYLLTELSPEEVSDFYHYLGDGMNDVGKVRSKQWQRMILIVEKSNKA